jgi:hypothetical protein
LVGAGALAAGFWSRASSALFIADLKPRIPLSDSFAEFGEFLRPEHEQSNPENHQQMHGLKESFDHGVSLFLSGSLPTLGWRHCDRSFRAQRLVQNDLTILQLCNRSIAE